MKEPSTWIKLDRNILQWRWYTDANTFRVFVHLLLNANIADHDFRNETIHRGELATSMGHIAESLGISYKNVRTALLHLEMTQEVAIKRQAKYIVISIINYDRYQSNGRQSAGNRQAIGNQVATIKEYKEREERKNNITAVENTTKDVKGKRVDYGGVWLTDKEFDSLSSMVEDNEQFLLVLDRVGEWLEEHPRPKNRHKTVVKTFLQNDGII